MDVGRHWLAYERDQSAAAYVLLDEVEAAVMLAKGFRIEGPFSPSTDHSGAVSTLEKIATSSLPRRDLQYLAELELRRLRGQS